MRRRLLLALFLTVFLALPAHATVVSLIDDNGTVHTYSTQFNTSTPGTNTLYLNTTQVDRSLALLIPKDAVVSAAQLTLTGRDYNLKVLSHRVSAAAGTSNLNALAADATRNGTYGGGAATTFFLYNATTGTATNLQSLVTAAAGSLSLLALALDEADDLAYGAGTTGRFFVYNRATNTVTNLTAKISGFWSTSAVNALAQDAAANLTYLAGAAGKFAVYTRASDTATDLSAAISSFWGTNGTFALAFNATGNLTYLGGANGNVAVYNATSGTATHLLSRFLAFDQTWNASNNTVRALAVDGSGVYVATANGRLAYYNASSDTAFDLTSSINSFWGTSAANALSLHASANRLYLAGAGSKFALFQTNTLGTTNTATDASSNASRAFGTSDINALSLDSTTGFTYVAGASAKMAAWNQADFPSGVTLDAADSGGGAEFTFGGRLDNTNENQVTGSFHTTINTFLAGCTALASGHCYVPLEFNASDDGFLEVGVHNLTYTVDYSNAIHREKHWKNRVGLFDGLNNTQDVVTAYERQASPDSDLFTTGYAINASATTCNVTQIDAFTSIFGNSIVTDPVTGITYCQLDTFETLLAGGVSVTATDLTPHIASAYPATDIALERIAFQPSTQRLYMIASRLLSGGLLKSLDTVTLTTTSLTFASVSNTVFRGLAFGPSDLLYIGGSKFGSIRTFFVYNTTANAATDLMGTLTPFWPQTSIHAFSYDSTHNRVYIVGVDCDGSVCSSNPSRFAYYDPATNTSVDLSAFLPSLDPESAHHTVDVEVNPLNDHVYFVKAYTGTFFITGPNHAFAFNASTNASTGVFSPVAKDVAYDPTRNELVIVNQSYVIKLNVTSGTSEYVSIPVVAGNEFNGHYADVVLAPTDHLAYVSNCCKPGVWHVYEINLTSMTVANLSDRLTDIWGSPGTGGVSGAMDLLYEPTTNRVYISGSAGSTLSTRTPKLGYLSRGSWRDHSVLDGVNGTAFNKTVGSQQVVGNSVFTRANVSGYYTNGTILPALETGRQLIQNVTFNFTVDLALINASTFYVKYYNGTDWVNLTATNTCASAYGQAETNYAYTTVSGVGLFGVCYTDSGSNRTVKVLVPHLSTQEFEGGGVAPDPQVLLTLNGVDDDLTITFGATSNATGACNYTSGLYLFRDGALVGTSNPSSDVQTFPPGSYNYTLVCQNAPNTLNVTVSHILNVSNSGLILDCPLYATSGTTDVTAKLLVNGVATCDASNVWTFVDPTTGTPVTLSPTGCTDGIHTFGVNTSATANYSLTAFETSGAYEAFNATCLILRPGLFATDVPDTHPLLVLLALLGAAVLLARRKN